VRINGTEHGQFGSFALVRGGEPKSLQVMTMPTPTSQNGASPLLRQTGLRHLLSEPQLQQLERSCRQATRKPGVTMFRQGDPADMFYLLVEGMVELRARPPGRRAYRTVELIGPSCTFGDEALFGDNRYLASARVMESARILALSRPAFDVLSSSHPDVAIGVLRCAGACLIKTIGRSAILTQAPADVGLRLLLEELASNGAKNGHPKGEAVPVRITHAQLAGVLHISRETVSRMLSQLAGDGSLEVGRGVIRVRPA
jgi:CRP-like cAMP-binding protein